MQPITMQIDDVEFIRRDSVLNWSSGVEIVGNGQEWQLEMPSVLNGVMRKYITRDPLLEHGIEKCMRYAQRNGITFLRPSETTMQGNALYVRTASLFVITRAGCAFHNGDRQDINRLVESYGGTLLVGNY